ncbi:hypothetical protein E3N88_24079 [Mikania micrantha]|uniref:Uncharacterized protein n=1 Tax=Mikania micrantha TaxID=192012 RepID=A0A5N6NHS6_9ASTR|nr:hypothetical protein E3N88_24079 [Mikania micrantha]
MADEHNPEGLGHEEEQLTELQMMVREEVAKSFEATLPTHKENECPVEREQIQEQRKKKNSGFPTPRATRGPQETLSRYATGGNDKFTPHLMMPVDPTILSGSGTRRATRREWRYMSRYATGLKTQKIKFMIWKTAEGAHIRFGDDQRRHWRRPRSSGRQVRQDPSSGSPRIANRRV